MKVKLSLLWLLMLLFSSIAFAQEADSDEKIQGRYKKIPETEVQLTIRLERQILLQAEIFEIPLDQSVALLSVKKYGDDSSMVKNLRAKNGTEGIQLVAFTSLMAQSGMRSRTELSKFKEHFRMSDLVVKDSAPVPSSHRGTVLEFDPVLGADNVTIDLNLSLEHSQGKVVLTEREIASPIDGGEIKFQTQSQDTVRFTTQITMFDGQTRMMGSANSSGSDTVLVAFISANIQIVGE